jgi:hypothetical protein
VRLGVFLLGGGVSCAKVVVVVFVCVLGGGKGADLCKGVYVCVGGVAR